MKRLIAPIFCLLMLVTVLAQEKAAEPPRYSEKKPSRDGVGKVYMGREIAGVVSFHAIKWLERKERVREEAPQDVVENMDLKPTDVVADIGAGSGYFSYLMAAKVPDGKVLAVDINQKMLDYINAKSRKDSITNVETLLGTIEDTRLPEGKVDAVLMVDAYHEFSHPFEMMTTVVRGLRSGGRVILLEYRGEDPSVPIKPLHKMTEKQSIAEMRAVGLVHQETKEFLPRQHFMVFVKPGA